MHGSRWRELETEHPVMVTAVKRPAGETRGKVAAGPDTGQCHRASSRPYSRFIWDVAVLEMGEDEGGAGDVADLAGADGDVLEGAPAAVSRAKPRSPGSAGSSALRVRV